MSFDGVIGKSFCITLWAIQKACNEFMFYEKIPKVEKVVNSIKNTFDNSFWQKNMDDPYLFYELFVNFMNLYD
jgi:hypothetical protein